MSAIREAVGEITGLYERARTRAIGSDPGWLRLRMAGRTTAALACSLVVLFLLTKATGQPLTVALLGVVITMVASRSINEPDPRQQRITMGLLPVPAAVAITAAALLAPHRVAGDAVFVVVVFGAAYSRRFGARGRALGMVAFMSYFFSLYLRARITELPWMIGAVAVGTVCTYVISTYVLPDRPERVLRATIRALRARMAIVVDTTADTVRTGRFDERRRRMRARTIRLNETALMVQTQIEDKADPAMLSLGVAGKQLAPWLFDAELAIEWVATAGRRVADVAAEIPESTRHELVDTLAQLARAIRSPRSDGLRRAGERARGLLERSPVPAGVTSTVPRTAGAPGAGDPADAAVRRLALAIANAANASAEVRAIVERTAAGAPAPASGGPDAGAAPGTDRRTGLLPTTRQAIQVSVAASLAIVTGELVSPLRWYWAVIAAFVIFAGTNSWGETLTKGWQRLLGTVLGVPCGMLVATLVSGNAVVSLVLIFVCLFCAFYFMTVTYSLMIFWITTMLALLYGLLGEFSFDVLLLRIEETAIGAVIGVGVAILVLPTDTRTAIRDDARAFLTTLSALIETSAAAMLGGGGAVSPTERARQLDRDLQQFRTTAKPLLVGVAGFAGRRSVRRGLQLLTACDHFARSLARTAERFGGPLAHESATAFTATAAQTRRNIDALIAALDGARAPTIASATDALDTAEALARQHDGGSPPRPDTRRFLTAVHSLRQIDRLVATVAADLGARDDTRVGAPTAG